MGGVRRQATLALSLLLALAGVAAADTDQATHSVSISVPKAPLSITDDTGNFALTFEDPIEGALTNTQVVNYRLKGNGLPTSSLEGVVSASLGSELEDIEVQADVGSFTNEGSAGNIILTESGGGFLEIEDDLTPLADKGVTTGNQASVLNGTLAVSWRAEAEQDLAAGEYPASLTVTLKDS